MGREGVDDEKPIDAAAAAAVSAATAAARAEFCNC